MHLNCNKIEVIQYRHFTSLFVWLGMLGSYWGLCMENRCSRLMVPVETACHAVVPVCLVQWRTRQSLLTSTVQSLFRHTARMIGKKKILFALPPEDWKRLSGCPQIVWLKTVKNDLKSHNLTLTEAFDVAKNCWLRRLLATFGAVYYSGVWCKPSL